MTTSETSGLDLELTRTTFDIMPTASSIGLDIRFSISLGAAPGYSVRTVNVGYEISGKRFMGSRLKDINPKMTSVAISITTVTRLFVENSTIFKFYYPLS
jgi:hypothetical protein